MEGTSLYEFYAKVILPQFGMKGVDIQWLNSQDVGPDETVHYFYVEGVKYALIFEDFDGLGRDEDFVREHVDLQDLDFSYVKPTSASANTPSYSIRFPVPYKHCHNVTGTFTLIKSV
ncbi:MAG TPA: hypothetical protein VK978_03960 [Candidatus Saccharimonadales bacterium]|nr:hypothetical protein [Candidatus Saccharimonadales bacterium]